MGEQWPASSENHNDGYIEDIDDEIAVDNQRQLERDLSFKSNTSEVVLNVEQATELVKNATSWEKLNEALDTVKTVKGSETYTAEEIKKRIYNARNTIALNTLNADLVTSALGLRDKYKELLYPELVTKVNTIDELRDLLFLFGTIKEGGRRFETDVIQDTMKQAQATRNITSEDLEKIPRKYSMQARFLELLKQEIKLN